jgi:hypothetical protein
LPITDTRPTRNKNIVEHGVSPEDRNPFLVSKHSIPPANQKCATAKCELDDIDS